jgi:hypothetical protein
MVCPYVKELTVEEIKACVAEMVDAGLVILYGNGFNYLQFKGFHKNQTINREREGISEIPSPESFGIDSGVHQEEVTVKLNQIKSNQIKYNVHFACTISSTGRRVS